MTIHTVIVHTVPPKRNTSRMCLIDNADDDCDDLIDTNQALLEAGANVDIKSGRRYHLMDEAVLTGDQAIVRQVS